MISERHVNLTLGCFFENLRIGLIHSTGRRSSIVHSINVGRLLRTLTARFGSVRCRFERSSPVGWNVYGKFGTMCGGIWRDLQSFLARKGISPSCPVVRKMKDLCKVLLVTGTLDRSRRRSNWAAHVYFGSQTRWWSVSARQLDTPVTRF